jgi:DNA-binding winged helix-turn-helix (wHTH) protein
MIRFGEFLLDIQNQRLFEIEGQEQKSVDLTPKEFQILSILVNRGRQLVSYNDLMRELWPDEDKSENDILINRIQVHISKLKGKINDDMDEPRFIRNIQKRGYSFIADVEILESESSKLIIEEAPEIPAPEKTIPEREQSDRSQIPLKNPSEPTATSRPFSWILTTKGLLVVLALLGVIVATYYWLSNKLDEKQAFVVNRDGSWTVTVYPITEGVKLENDSLRYELVEGDTIEVKASGRVDIGRGPVSPDGEPDYGDPSMDGPFKDRVGGLEMWIGTDKALNRYFIGSSFRGKVNHSGIPTFRVIESLRGYQDGNNSGFYYVTIRKIIEEN